MPWAIAASTIVAQAMAQARPGEVVRVPPGEPLPVRLPVHSFPKPLDCHGCGAPLERHAYHCLWCKRPT